jgi:hypothetical protein
MHSHLLSVCNAGQMATFDAELYLRRAAERSLDKPGHWSAIQGLARALVVADQIDADQAWRTISDYAPETHSRWTDPSSAREAPPHRRQTQGLAARQFRVINEEITVAGVQVLVRDLAVTGDGGTLRYRLNLAVPLPGEVSRMLRQRPFPWNAIPPDIVDSDGQRPIVDFGDGGRDGEGFVDGELELHGQIATEATWLEIDGIRVELHTPAARWEASIETLLEESPVERFLWRHLAVVNPRSGEIMDLEPMIDALVTAGAVEEGSPLVRELRAVRARMPRHPLHQRRVTRAPASGLVAPWGSLLDREGADDGPEWTLALGAVAPVCDGVQFAANSITSDLDGFQVEVDVTPNLSGVGALDELPVDWWARDDLGNHYLGILFGSGVRGHAAQGTVRYWPALDRRSKRLEVLMCVESHCAVVSISLPEGQHNN